MTLSDEERRITDEQREVVAANLGLVGRIAAIMAKGDEQVRDDYYQAGVVGLMRAVQLHDPATARLSTYSGCHIQQAIQRLREADATIRPPFHARSRGLSAPSTTSLDRLRASKHGDEAYDPADPRASPEAIRLDDDDEAEAVRRAVDMLPDQERRVAALRLAGATYDEVRADLRTSWERTRAIEAAAWDKLRDWLAKLAS